MKNKRSPNVLKDCGVQILFEVLHVKSLSLCVKYDIFMVLHLILFWCNVGMGV